MKRDFTTANLRIVACKSFTVGRGREEEDFSEVRSDLQKRGMVVKYLLCAVALCSCYSAYVRSMDYYIRSQYCRVFSIFHCFISYISWGRFGCVYNWRGVDVNRK